MSKQAPGTWHSKNWHSGNYTIHDAQGNKIADFVHPDVVNVMAAAPEMLDALEAIVELAGEAYQHWEAENEMEVGRILLALSGVLSGYNRRIDAIHALIDKAKGEQK